MPCCRSCRRIKLEVSDLAQVVTHVHQGAIDVLGPVVNPVTVHQSKFSMGTVLALVAQHGHAGLAEFDAHFASPGTQALRDKVSMVLDAEVDSRIPATLDWQGHGAYPGWACADRARR
jgi:2-methylcitrate dehydratase PrpD